MNPLAICGVLLAVSVVLNGWLVHVNAGLYAEVGVAVQAQKDTKMVAESCGKSVDALAAAAAQRHADTQAALQKIAPKLKVLNSSVVQTLNAKPADPANLCNSALLLAKAAILAGKTGGSDAKP